MLLAKEFGVQLGDALSPPGAGRRRTAAKLVPWSLDPRVGGGGTVSPGGRGGDGGIGGVGDWRISLSGGGGGEMGGYSSHESELDLAMLVSDFLENGSGGADSRCSSDSDSGFSDLAHLAEKISLYRQGGDELENDMLAVVRTFLLSIHESELHTVCRGQCNGSCIRHLLVKLLRFSGYDAAVCTSKWQGVDKIPGGDHEYIDVIVNNNMVVSERLIIDIDFRSHFEIARAVESYDALLNSLPVVYVGTLPRLKQFLHVMVEGAKWSLKQNSMPLPPWRSLTYIQAKWHSKYERKVFRAEQDFYGISSDHMQCIGHLERLKSSLQSEVEIERFFKPIKADKKRRTKFERQRRSLLGS